VVVVLVRGVRVGGIGGGGVDVVGVGREGGSRKGVSLGRARLEGRSEVEGRVGRILGDGGGRRGGEAVGRSVVHVKDEEWRTERPEGPFTLEA
jgi:hypothetical protein